MSKRLSKGLGKYKRDNSNDKIIQLSELELEELVDNKIKKATVPLEKEIKELKFKLNKICTKQNFISEKHDESLTNTKPCWSITKNRKNKLLN